WKSGIKELMVSTNDPTIAAEIYGAQNTYSGITTLMLTFFFSAPIMRRGWRFAASFTPVVALICTILFFAFLYFQNGLSSLTNFFHVTPILFAVRVGLANVVFIKSAKYILFGPAKEQAYLPLDEEAKV